MQYEFTDRVRKVIAGAREVALRLRHDYLGPEHLLLALLESPDDAVLEALEGAGVDPEWVRGELESRIRPGQAEVAPSELPYTSRAKRVLELAMKASRRRNGVGGGRRGSRRARSSPVDAVDLLLALVDEERSIAAVVLRQAGLGSDVAGSARGDRSGRGGAEPVEPARPELALAIDDGSDRSIYEQIVEQIQERIAVGELKPGERLPTVRRLADRLDIAPGTVARAYGELERLGLVVTDGARGTRVAERERPAVPDRERAETLTGLLRPVAVAAFHLGATAEELRRALEEAMAGIFGSGGASAA